MTLYRLAVNCDYSKLEGEMIRDRLVIGITDIALSRVPAARCNPHAGESQENNSPEGICSRAADTLSRAEGPSESTVSNTNSADRATKENPSRDQCRSGVLDEQETRTCVTSAQPSTQPATSTERKAIMAHNANEAGGAYPSTSLASTQYFWMQQFPVQPQEEQRGSPTPLRREATGHLQAGHRGGGGMGGA